MVAASFLRGAAIFGCISTALCRSIPLVTFDGAAATTHKWKQMNDPVMGGKSTGTFKVENGLGIFDGEVVDVPFLKAPGFIKADVADFKPLGRIFPDITGCKAIELELKADSDYTGYRFSFGTAHPPEGKFFASGYKADMSPPVGKFGTVTLPLDHFTDLWDDATGKAIKTCQEDSKYCPDAKTLTDLRTVAVWAEGVAGKVHLELKSISAAECPDEVSQPEALVV
mmetsp:Transcript_65884/g.157501  ORF Transcript_65884/g.157501 Transcript_65884/m.157501 type:complete len:226 (-) Transcript_65884:100-777(-)|eukprot:CAMPEP_0178423330 /NCGR_PEP_ID=MMETSP0689_2-20121128/27631_1 /TAXON_ID=160604 /ORGANISM="Amphidinium massartii, Strain CS-259" /LENGTH=225 /DNA_ID=CAMNT_0020044917 /DNA_START=42 /DNA_END=719 /DNA_ORIENTATION=+